MKTLLRIHLMRQGFGTSDPPMEGTMHDVPLLRSLAGLDPGEDAIPDETTILKSRRLLERQQLVWLGLLLHGDETVVVGDRAYTRNDRNLAAEREPDELVWAFPFKRNSGTERTAEQTLLNRMLAPMRAVVEHPFRILKRPFGYTQVRYRAI